jgi:hypothetical protein
MHIFTTSWYLTNVQERTVSSINGAKKNWISKCRRMKLGLCHHVCKSKSKWIQENGKYFKILVRKRCFG